MTYGITPQGFVRKPYDVIEREIQDQARSGEYFGSDIDLSDESPLGAEIKLKAWAIDRQWQLAEGVYYSTRRSTAEGVDLDRVVKLGFITRQAASYALVSLQFSGDIGSPIPAGTQAETAKNIVYKTLTDAVISESGTVVVTAQCISKGIIGNVPNGMINSIKTPLPGVNEVTNTSLLSPGQEIESDFDVDERYDNLPAATGSSVPALYSALLNVAGVISAMVFENTGNDIDSNGLPPKSIEAVVQGGVDIQIAETIFSKKAGGIDMHGSQEVLIIDNQGIQRTIKFSRPENIDVFVEYQITTNSDWDDENIPVMKRNAIKYIGGVDDLFVEYGGVGISKSVFAWKLIAAQSEISGIESISVLIGKVSPPVITDKLDFLPREKPYTDPSKISVV